MNRKIVAVWISLAMLFGIVIILVDIAQIVRAPMVIYVDDVPGEGPNNPKENYTSIQDAIDNATVGDTVFVYNGTYYENVIVYVTINLTGEDWNTTIIDGQWNGDVIRVEADYVNITGFTVKRSGNQSSSPYDSGIELDTVHNCSIIYNNISSNRYGLRFTYADNDNLVAYNNITSNSQSGMYLWSSSNNSITNNNVTDNFYSIFLHTSNYNGLTNNTLTENCWGYELYQSCHNDIYNNYVDSLNRGVNLRTNSNENQVINNNLSYQTCGVVMRENSNENVILNNTMFENSYYGIELSGSHNNHIIDNYISSNRQYGIYIASSLQNTITGNTLLGDSIYIRGFSLDYWNTHDIDTLNTVNGKPVYYWKNITGGVIPPGAGQVILANCDNIVIENQELIDASVGILLGYSSFNNIEYNDISSHKEYSITLYESHWNDFNHNTITSENIGVYLKDSNDNTFHHNNFQNFYRQVNFENSINNHWDDGFGEGNFWSDYKGKDNGSGGRTAGDGVGDTEIPHPFINKGNGYYRLDNYPLMFPIGNYTFLYQGWNLISIPFIQSDTELGTVLSPITDSYDAVQWLNVYDLTDPWKHYHTLKPSHLNDLYEITHVMGFWIHIIYRGGALLEYNGTQPTSNQSIALHPGWNLVSYPSLTSRNRTTALNNLTFGTHVDAILSYNAATQKWDKIDEFDYFQIGKGYYIHAKSECEWEVPL